MVEQRLNPTYTEIMRELGIEIISTEKTPNCPYNLMNPNKQGLKLEKLGKIHLQESNLYFLRYYKKIWFLKIVPKENLKTLEIPKFQEERA